MYSLKEKLGLLAVRKMFPDISERMAASAEAAEKVSIWAAPRWRLFNAKKSKMATVYDSFNTFWIYGREEM